MAGPPPHGTDKKKRQRLIMIGAAGVLLLFLYLRSQGSSSGTAASSTNATNATDTQAAVDQAVQQQQAQDAATYGYGAYGSAGSYGDGSGGSGGGFDTTGITSGLSTIDTDLQNLPAAIAGYSYGSAAAPATATTDPTATPAITTNVNGQPAGGSKGKITLPAPIPGVGHYVDVNGKPQLIHAIGHNKWAPGPAPIRNTGHTSHHKSVRHKTVKKRRR